MTLTRILLTAFAHASLVAAQSSGGNFINPPASPAEGQSAGDYSQDPVYVVGATLTVQWQTSIPSLAVSLGLWQQNGPDDQAGTTVNPNTTLDSTVWDGIPNQDLSAGRVFFMQIYDINDNLNLLATSHYFNLTGDKPGSASSSSASSSSAATSPASTSLTLATSATRTTSSTSSSTLSTSTTTSSSPDATSTTVPSSGSNHTLAIGVGVGVGVAVFLAAAGTAIGAFFFLRHRKLKKRQSAALSTGDPSPYQYSSNHELDSKATTAIVSHPSWQDSTRQEEPLRRQELG